MRAAGGGTVRCAIYTRKSSEEGLEQDFNSLDAQREACGAYILSQASEGWQAVSERYDDGGISGGTLERPGLQRLLADVAAGRIDIIVVYKVDRLTRSLLDFAKLVEAFDRASVSFVSVTQAFNTTTSMGRLTLNMLLSFAQFEREVTAERIRDKLAASKARGMWMGGIPPLGYRPDGRSLAIVEEHAGLVRQIYTRYLELGSVRALQEELNAQGIIAPRRMTASGRAYGGGAFSRGQLYFVLRNPIYAGDIPHRRKVHQPKGMTVREIKIYPGNHPAIIARAQWDAVQRQLADNCQGERRGRVPTQSLLAGRIVDAAGMPLIASHASKPGAGGSAARRYRYYVSKALAEGTASASEGWRLAAREIERLVLDELLTLLADPYRFAERAGLVVRPADLPRIDRLCAAMTAQLRAEPLRALAELDVEVIVRAEGPAIALATQRLAGWLELEPGKDTPSQLILSSSVRLARTGHVMRFVRQDGGTVTGQDHDPSLIKLLLRSRTWWHCLRQGDITPTQLAANEGFTVSYLLRALRLAFLSPAIVSAILEGALRADVDATRLLAAESYPLRWSEQEAALLPG